MSPTAATLPKPTELRDFQAPSVPKAVWQLVNSLVPYFALWAIMIQTVKWSYPLTLALGVVASGFLVRVFIIFHDCGHGSFLPSRRWNEFVGFFTGVLTLTPHREWWHNHSLHHARSGNLDKRGVGDIWTMTVDEFRHASRLKRLGYFLVREPVFMLTVGPLLVFALQHRFPTPASGPAEKRSILLTNLVLAAAITALCLTIGWKAYLMIHLPILIMAGAAGIWLFYVQHQFEDTYWNRDEQWDFAEAAFAGSSFYRLPRVLQWFSGNIGFHHVHHLSPKIPNYRLEACHRKFAALRTAPELGLRASLETAKLRLWDSERRKLVGWPRRR